MTYKGKRVHKTVRMQTDSYMNKETERRTDEERAVRWYEGKKELSIR